VAPFEACGAIWIAKDAGLGQNSSWDALESRMKSAGIEIWARARGRTQSRHRTQKEFPESWFKHAKLSPTGRDCSLNHFGVYASQPLSEWQNKGWIHQDDPRGWFQ
jgi:hypothetical protein